MASNNNNEHTEPETKANASTPIEDAEITTSTSDNKNNKKTNKTTPKDNKAKPANRGVKVAIAAIILSLLIGGGLTYQQQQYQIRLDAMQQQLQKAQQTFSQQLAQTEKKAEQTANNTLHRAETIQAQQQKSIESLQVALADVKGRRPNDWLLAEADYLVKMAGRKLYMERDPVTATQLLESADQRIAALNDPSLVKLRQSMANDITTLKAMPIIDRDGLILRIMSLQQQVDKLPLANAILPKKKQEEKKVKVSNDINNWQENLKTSAKDFADNFITFRTRDGNVIPLLSPEQHFYLKENLKAKLDTAIKAIYSEDSKIYKTALDIAQQWSHDFFNQNDNSVQEFTKTLNELSKKNIQVTYPDKLETQKVLADVIRERLRRDVTGLSSEEAK